MRRQLSEWLSWKSFHPSSGQCRQQRSWTGSAAAWGPGPARCITASTSRCHPATWPEGTEPGITCPQPCSVTTRRTSWWSPWCSTLTPGAHYMECKGRATSQEVCSSTAILFSHAGIWRRAQWAGNSDGRRWPFHCTMPNEHHPGRSCNDLDGSRVAWRLPLLLAAMLAALTQRRTRSAAPLELQTAIPEREIQTITENADGNCKVS